jgi:hypothetical protein
LMATDGLHDLRFAQLFRKEQRRNYEGTRRFHGW